MDVLLRLFYHMLTVGIGNGNVGVVELAVEGNEQSGVLITYL